MSFTNLRLGNRRMTNALAVGGRQQTTVLQYRDLFKTMFQGMLLSYSIPVKGF
ncbi:hypothetical protein P1X15_18830 [Runella sp. MFBS21]|uniref:hypothetical protein n=1 Tax=Runella sp. MFBS21 TaxID=3034018 RepID=UPI0023F63731|nr:hypothetical protein [Runella sp. MFBS21]MDF7819682.1 hypothetical protein [Runella sp. MFBS21]